MLDIAEVARRTAIPASTLRYYEERGLIASIGRRGLRRVFDRCVLRDLAVISLWRSAGFSLAEIADMLPRDGKLCFDRQSLQDRADAIDSTIQQLTSQRDMLLKAAGCPEVSFLDCERFQQHILRAANATSSLRRGRRKVKAR
jgi:DNA-binding transcriptional MerR regulator